MVKHLLKIHPLILLSIIFVVLMSMCIVLLPFLFEDHHLYTRQLTALATSTPATPPPPVAHVAPPEYIRGLYMTSWVASSEKLRSKIVRIFDTTNANSLVIDIKDYSGRIVFPVSDSTLKAYGSEEIRVPDMKEFIDSLHRKGIYVIGRVAVFQDAYMSKTHPELAVQSKRGGVWKDRKGISWIDASSEVYQQYIVRIAREAYSIGFDEINFDYIRFPSDGDMSDTVYAVSSSTPKRVVMEHFFTYLDTQLRHDTPRPLISADLFGLTTTAHDDMGIGQVFADALPHFDYIDPMIYPSHYAPGSFAIADPEAHPKEIITAALTGALDTVAHLSTSTRETSGHIRPWLQDFGLKHDYGVPEVKAQIDASEALGVTSWLMWSPSNVYTVGALSGK